MKKKRKRSKPMPEFSTFLFIEKALNPNISDLDAQKNVGTITVIDKENGNERRFNS